MGGWVVTNSDDIPSDYLILDDFKTAFRSSSHMNGSKINIFPRKD
jgi:hypothetical protein